MTQNNLTFNNKCSSFGKCLQLKMSRSPRCSNVSWHLNRLQGLLPCFGTIFCWQTFKRQIFVIHSQHQINQSVGLLCDPARTSVLEIPKEDGERGISKDGSGNWLSRPGHSVQWCGHCWAPKSSYSGPGALRHGLWAMWGWGSSGGLLYPTLPFPTLWVGCQPLPNGWGRAVGAQQKLCPSLPSLCFSHSPNSLPEWIKINWIRGSLFLNESV